MSYSRRQLYAMGEPIGDSATYRKADGGLVLGDGGGGGGGNQQPANTTQTTISELPEWARGYAKDTLAKASALTDVNQNPYQTYGGERLAGFSPLQTQAQQAAGQMGVAGQTYTGTGLATMAGLGGLGQQYQGGQFYGGQFTPEASQQYMSPYMQNVLNRQMQSAARVSDIQAQQNKAQATQAGAFGGSRQGIVEAERQKNLATQLGQIQAEGTQKAYEDAQAQFNADMARNFQAQQAREQSRQFGATQGLQGLQTALSAAGTLGNLGQQQSAQQLQAYQTQQAAGAQQQALRQQGLDLAYQDFLNQQNYPYKQLGFMADMIRGLPLGQTSTAQMYQAAPSTVSQIAGLGTAGLGAMGLYNAATRAKGGTIKEPKSKAPAGLAELALSKMA